MKSYKLKLDKIKKDHERAKYDYELSKAIDKIILMTAVGVLAIVTFAIVLAYFMF